MPINNLIVQYLTKVLGLSEYFTAWKETAMLLIMMGLIYCIIVDFKHLQQNKKSLTSTKLVFFKFFWPIIAAISLTILSLISSFVVNDTEIKVYAFGYLFELWWMNFFVIVCNWWLIRNKRLKYLSKADLKTTREANSNFLKGLTTSILVGFILVTLVSISSLVFGPKATLSPFGYGIESTNSEFISTTPLCHVVDPSLPECRLMASFTQPIHYAGYLLFIIAFLAVLIYQNQKLWQKIIYLVGIFLAIYFLFQSYTRYALLGLAVILSGAVLQYLVSKNDISLRLSKVLTGLMLFIPLVISVYFINLDPKITSAYLPQSLSKEQSTDQHYRHAANSFNIVKKSDSRLIFGYGLGATGSASKEKYQNFEDNPIYKKFYSTDNFWQLPPNRFILPENWFVSTLLNVGIFYALIYLAIIAIPFYSIFKLFRAKEYSSSLYLQTLLSLGFFGIVLGNLFQHLWENQTLTVYWTILWLWGRMLIAQTDKTKTNKNVATIVSTN
jgi:hypothetical protein